MKLTKKILSLILAAALLLGTVVIAANAEGLTAQGGSVLTYKVEADKTDVKIGETVTISVYMTTNYYTGAMGGEFFLWTSNVFQDFDNTTVGSFVTAKNFASNFSNTITKAAAGAYPSTHGSADYVGAMVGRVYDPLSTPIQILDNELVYEIKLTVKDDESLIDSKATFELPAGSVRTNTNQSRKYTIYQTINANPTGGAWSEAANCAETVNLDEAKITLNIVSKDFGTKYCDYATLISTEDACDSVEYPESYYPANEYEAWEAALEAANKIIDDMNTNGKAVYSEAEQAKIDKAASDLQAAYDALVAGFVDTTPISDALAAYGTAPLAEEYYAASAWSAHQAAVRSANANLTAFAQLPDSAENREAVADVAAAVKTAYDNLVPQYVDLTALKAAIDACDTPAYAEDYYDATAYATWEAALAAANQGVTDYEGKADTAANQEAVAALTKDLTDAFAALDPSVLDLTPLTNAIAASSTPAYAAEYYDEAAYAAWEAALAAAEKGVEDYTGAANTAANQQAIADLAKDLTDAFAALVPAFVDLTELEKACYDCHNPMLEPEWFDADEYAAWEAAYAAAEKGVEDYTDKADTEENRAAVAKLAKDLVDAYNELDPRSVDVSDLEKAIAESVPAYAAEYYDAAAYKAFEDAVAAGTAIVNEMGGGKAPDTAENRATVADAAKAIRDAYAKLVPAFLDTSSITETISLCVPEYAEEYYDAAAWSDYQNTVAQAAKAAEDMKILADTEENREMVYNWTNAVLDVYAALVPSFVSYEKLEKAIADYGTTAEPMEYYTPDSWAAYAEALAAAKEANNNRPDPLPAATEANQAAVDKFATDLETAYNNLKAAVCSIISVTAMQENYVKGDIVNFEFLCEGTGFSKIQVITPAGTTATYHRTHTAVKEIRVDGENEIWVIALKVPSNETVLRYAKAKMDRSWDYGVRAFEIAPTKEDAEVKSVEVLLDGEVVTEFLNTDVVTVKIVTGPATRRIRIVNPVSGTTATYSTPAEVNLDGTKVWTITRKYTTVKAYDFDVYTAGANNVLVDSGKDLEFSVSKVIVPDLPSTGNVEDAVLGASVAKARVRVGATQTFTIATDKNATQVRLVNANGEVVTKTSAVASEDGTAKTFVISRAYTGEGEYNYTVEALYGNTWIAGTADTAVSFKVIY